MPFRFSPRVIYKNISELKHTKSKKIPKVSFYSGFKLSYCEQCFFNDRSQWNSDQWTRGSYTYIKVGSSKDDMNALAEPLVCIFQVLFY